MGKTVVMAGLAGAAILLAGSATRVWDLATSPRPPSTRAPDRRPTGHPAMPPKRDGRRPRPNVHRAGPAELELRNRVAQAESDKLQLLAQRRAQGFAPAAISVAATSWVSLGPTSAFNEFNGVAIPGIDSGRPSSIVVDPRDPDVVYVAVSGGGVWKTFDFLSPSGPTWVPLTDTLPNLAVGALAIDDAQPDTLYLGNGDFVDGSGNTVLRSSNGGRTWDRPVVLSGFVSAVRSIGVHGAQVVAGTDIGVFVSSDGGSSFHFVDMPNPLPEVIESIWSVVHTGGGHWVASGVTACDDLSGPAPLAGGLDPGVDCSLGNNGEIWTSADGVTWRRSTVPARTGTGRIMLAAGPTANPAATVVYAYVGSTDGSGTIGLWRSNDGGATWTDATGTLANPTLPTAFPPDCGSLDLGHQQTWYNQAIVVDPTSADHVLIGGDLCGARTLNGTAAAPTWELISHWLPNEDSGATTGGLLPYVHADWHTATSVVMGGVVRTFAGSDGGLFSSTDLFTATQPEQVTWSNHNRGLVTHLAYSVGSGDPTTMNPFVLMSGLQDNGTRFRASAAMPSVFNQPVGGDGIGTTIHVATSGTTYWTSIEFGHLFCRPSATVDCADGTSWSGPLDPKLAVPPPAPDQAAGDDEEPFFVHYANVETDTTGQSVLTHTTGQIFVAVLAAGTLSWKPISQDLTRTGNGFGNVTASRTIPGLYGAAGSTADAPFFVTTAGNTATTWTAAQPVIPAGQLSPLNGPSSIDFPPVTPSGFAPGQVFIGAFAGTLDDAFFTPPPTSQGRLYRTTDGGQTWASIVGTDPNHQLPNVAIYVVKYDPVTPTTIYAGTDLGVYISTSDGASWNRMGEGFPVVPVRDIYVAKNQDFIRVATYGRGLWEIYPSATANQGAPGNGDYDRNLAIDWIDLAATSSRLGVTPASTSPPFYSWILDVSSSDPAAPLQQIDDADLVAVLARFGGHP
ncbi:MAG TPA: hypothetical protein VFK02_31635 [Kofleriaceae bacterium]|nr:hypothetical protein [Kofleriaceae bacterium]